MKVRELIEQLQRLDPDLYVVTRGYEGGYCDPHISDPMELVLDIPRHQGKWYYGPHDEPNEYGDELALPTVKAVCL